ncbi:MAG: YraN family protein [Caulobacteraceae bacterium]
MTPGKATSGRSARGRAARQAGRRAEALAALWLMLKGYKILGYRLKTRAGEIDILALKGRVLAVIEVKTRLTLETALAAVSHMQRERLRRAAGAVIARRPMLAGAQVRLDLVAFAPGRWPRHIPDAWPGV